MLLVACSPPRHPHPERACVPLADAQTEEQTATARGHQALLDAIAARGLALVTLPATDVHVTEMNNEWRSDGARLLAPITSWGCGSRPQSGDFVRSSAGELWALVPAPAARSQRTVASCGCRSTLAAGQRCGGAPPPPLQLAYDVPAGTTFKGTLSVPYDMDVVSISYADDHPGSHCPPMPPPAP